MTVAERVWRLVSLAAGALALWGALLAGHSEDPLRWGVLFGLGAVVGALGAADRLWWKVAGAYALLAGGVGAVHAVVGASGLEGRLGLLSAGACVVAATLTGWRWRRDPRGRRGRPLTNPLPPPSP